MNQFFMDKVEQLQQRIPPVDIDPLATLRESMSSRQCTMRLRPVHPEEVSKIIKDLKNSKSTGTDNIDTKIIKLIADDIVPAVTHIVNLSIRQKEFPNSWKMAKVTPLLKKGDPLAPKNYRPVALLPILSKILEKAIFLQIVDYLDSNHLIHPNHHGCNPHPNV